MKRSALLVQLAKLRERAWVLASSNPDWSTQKQFPVSGSYWTGLYNRRAGHNWAGWCRLAVAPWPVSPSPLWIARKLGQKKTVIRPGCSWKKQTKKLTSQNRDDAKAAASVRAAFRLTGCRWDIGLSSFVGHQQLPDLSRRHWTGWNRPRWSHSKFNFPIPPRFNWDWRIFWHLVWWPRWWLDGVVNFGSILTAWWAPPPKRAAGDT